MHLCLACCCRFVRAMQNYMQDEDSQDIYLEVAILVTDERQAPRQALLEVSSTRPITLITALAGQGRQQLDVSCCRVRRAWGPTCWS